MEKFLSTPIVDCIAVSLIMLASLTCFILAIIWKSKFFTIFGVLFTMVGFISFIIPGFAGSIIIVWTMAVPFLLLLYYGNHENTQPELQAENKLESSELRCSYCGNILTEKNKKAAEPPPAPYRR